MLNSTTRKDVFLLQRPPILATFETAVAVIAILMIVTSCLIVKNIYKKINRIRVNSMLMLFSISDIGVGVLSMPTIGIRYLLMYRLFEYHIHDYITLHIILYFSLDFPYFFFKCTHRNYRYWWLFIITWDNCYKTIIKEKRLKIIVAFLLAITIRYLCLDTYYTLPEGCCDTNLLLFGEFVGILTVSLIVFILAYMHILFIVQKSSKKVNLYSKPSNIKRDRRLFKTIFYIFLFQVTCVIPYLILLSLFLSNTSLPYDDIEPWLEILRNYQYFCNGFILLYNQKRNARKWQTLSYAKINENKYCKCISSFLTWRHRSESMSSAFFAIIKENNWKAKADNILWL